MILYRYTDTDVYLYKITMSLFEKCKNYINDVLERGQEAWDSVCKNDDELVKSALGQMDKSERQEYLISLYSNRCIQIQPMEDMPEDEEDDFDGVYDTDEYELYTEDFTLFDDDMYE